MEYVDPLGWMIESPKPLNSPRPDKWIKNNGSIWCEMDGTWVYQDADGVVVRYPDGYLGFFPHAVREVNVDDLKWNYSKASTGDFGKADAKAGSPADYKNNTWHHHENGKTMQEVPKKIHKKFIHRTGVYNLKKDKSCK